jgi:hypothetical protein
VTQFSDLLNSSSSPVATRWAALFLDACSFVPSRWLSRNKFKYKRLP